MFVVQLGSFVNMQAAYTFVKFFNKILLPYILTKIKLLESVNILFATRSKRQMWAGGRSKHLYQMYLFESYIHFTFQFIFTIFSVLALYRQVSGVKYKSLCINIRQLPDTYVIRVAYLAGRDIHHTSSKSMAQNEESLWTRNVYILAAPYP